MAVGRSHEPHIFMGVSNEQRILTDSVTDTGLSVLEEQVLVTVIAGVTSQLGLMST
jgi:hypothetical protein